MCWEPKGKFALSHLKNSKCSGLTNTHVLLLSDQNPPPHLKKNRFKTQKHPNKTQIQPHILDKSSSAVLASLLYYEKSQKLQ